MNYNVELAVNFKREAKKLIKKYPSLKKELVELFHELEKDPTKGVPLGNNIYKIRPDFPLFFEAIASYSLHLITSTSSLLYKR